MTRDCKTEKNHELAGFVAEREREIKKTCPMILRLGAYIYITVAKLPQKQRNFSKVAAKRQRKRLGHNLHRLNLISSKYNSVNYLQCSP